MSAAELHVRDLSEERYEEWSRLVASAPAGSPYHLPQYLVSLCRATGGSFRVRAVLQGEEILGGAVLYAERGPEGTVVSPRALLYYNGPILREYETRYPSARTRRHLRALEALEASLRGGEFARVSLKPRSPLTDVRIFQREGWSVRPVHTYVVPVADLDALRRRLDRNARRLINRAAKRGLKVTRDDDFDAFFRFHFETHERKGAPLYLSGDRFARYYEELAGAELLALYHARLPDGRSAASQLVLLGPHPVTHTVSAGGDDAHLDTGANPYLRWKVFEDLSRMGYEANDLTDASLNPVTDFKAQLGGDLEVCFELSRSRMSARVNVALRRSMRGVRSRLRVGLQQAGLL